STWTALLRCRAGGYRTSPTGLSPAVVDLSRVVRLNGSLVTPMCPVLQPRRDESRRFGLLRVRSPLLPESRLLSFPAGTEMFQLPPLAAARLWVRRAPVRGPRDQRSFDSSPGLIAVFHALRRLLAPRHPPHALRSLAALTRTPTRRART